MPLARGRRRSDELAVRAFGLNFPKSGRARRRLRQKCAVPDALLRLGFGFVEIGTVTPQPQAGNPRPRCSALTPTGG